MFVVDLECARGHLFEQWHENREAFVAARDARELECPLCGSREVSQRLSFRGVGSTSEPAAPTSPRAAPTPPVPMPMQMQKALSALLKAVRAHAEDVGEHFAAHAIAMHRGEEEQRPIYGTSTQEDEARLDEAGVPYLKVPVPDIDQN